MNGMVNKRIAEKYGVKRKTIANLLAGNVIPKRQREYNRWPETSERMRLKREKYAKIVELRVQEKKSSSQIAQEVGLKLRTVQKLCQDLGVSSTPGVNYTRRAPKSKSEHLKDNPLPVHTKEELRKMRLKGDIAKAMSRYKQTVGVVKVSLPRLSILE